MNLIGNLLRKIVLGNNAEHVPFSYRAWKWIIQRRYGDEWKSDLLDRIQQTDWDLLIILDACRFDSLALVSDCAIITKARSPASGTPSFLKAAKDRGIFDDTTYISANPQSEKNVPGENVDHIPLAEECWDDRLATVRPSDIYERAINPVREGHKVVAHTVQPHYPHICQVDGDVIPVQNGLHPEMVPDFSGQRFVVQEALARGLIDLDDAKRSYDIAVKFAWEKAKRIGVELSQDGHTVAITADHGELFGEWGLVEHPAKIGLRSLTEVPWVVFEPSPEKSDMTTVNDRLAALGYTE